MLYINLALAASFVLSRPAWGITIIPRSVWAEYIPYAALRDEVSKAPVPSKNLNWSPIAGVFIHYCGSTLFAPDYSDKDECKQDIADVWMDYEQGDKYEGDIVTTSWCARTVTSTRPGASSAARLTTTALSMATAVMLVFTLRIRMK